MIILITGAFGFVGTNLSAYLAAKGHELWALDVAPNGNGQSAMGKEDASCQDAKAQRGENAERSTLNVQRSSSGRGAYVRCYGWEELEKIPWDEVNAVVHLAGKAHDTRNASDPQSYFDINVGLTKKVLRSFVHDCESALVGKQEAIDNGQSAMGNGQWAIGNGQWAIGNGQWAIGNGQWAIGNGQSAMGNKQPAMGNGQWAVGNGQWAIGTENDSRQDAKAQRGERDNIPTLHDSNIPVKKFILFSSVKAVADRVEGVLTEAAVPNPQTAYGQSKLEAERLVRSSFVHDCESALVGTPEGNGQRAEGVCETTNEIMHFRTHELLTYILRPCMIHGPGNKGNLNLLYGVVRKGIPWPLGAFENRRSFASIGNVCAVVEGLLTRDAPVGIYQVADDETLSTNELIGLIACSLGKRPRIWRVPAGAIRWAARCGDLLRLPLNSERLKKLTESYVASNAKIKVALGWTSMPIRAEEGMRETLESFDNRQ